MNGQRIAVVWNPSKTTREELDAALAEAAPETGPSGVSWHETSQDDPGRSAARQAIEADADVVLAAGGDGTVRAVAEELARSRPPLDMGIIPLGTGNLLARNLGVPLGDLPAALTRALDHQARAIDIGWVAVTTPAGRTQRHAFTVMAGFGIDAHMITETDDDLKEKAGWLAYVESLGRAVAESTVIDIRVSEDGAAPVAEKAHTVMVGNCGTLQGGIALLPDADPADGELDLLILRADGIAGWADTLRTMVWDNGLRRMLTGGDRAESSAHRRVRTLTVDLDEPRVFEVDGDDIGEVARVAISIQPSAVRVR